MTDWRDQALCRDEDPELFFPIGVAGSSLQQINWAKAVCRQCPVSRQCLALALDSGQGVGIWGGLTAEERRTLRRRSLSARTR